MNKIKVALIRGAHLNPNELANYEKVGKNIALESFSSLKPLGTSSRLKNNAFFCPYDYPLKKISKFVLNRTLGDPHWLVNMEAKLKPFRILDTADPYYYFSYQAAHHRQKNRKKKLVCTYCETISFNNEKTKAKAKIKKKVMKVTDLFIVHTKRSAKCLQEEGVEKDRIKLIRLGVDLAKFKPKRAAPTNNILFVGRLVPEKGVWLIYEAFRQLNKEFKDLSLTLAGSGPLEKKLIEDVIRSGLDKKVVIKSQPYAKINRLYQKANIFAFASYQTKTWEEQYGMALVEAMASGLPIVAANSGAIAEVLGKAGFLVKQKSKQGLYQALKYLLENKSQKTALGKKARDRAKKNYDRADFADKIKAVYEQLANCNAH